MAGLKDELPVISFRDFLETKVEKVPEVNQAVKALPDHLDQSKAYQ